MSYLDLEYSQNQKFNHVDLIKYVYKDLENSIVRNAISLEIKNGNSELNELISGIATIRFNNNCKTTKELLNYIEEVKDKLDERVTNKYE